MMMCRRFDRHMRLTIKPLTSRRTSRCSRCPANLGTPYWVTLFPCPRGSIGCAGLLNALRRRYVFNRAIDRRQPRALIPSLKLFGSDPQRTTLASRAGCCGPRMYRSSGAQRTACGWSFGGRFGGSVRGGLVDGLPHQLPQTHPNSRI